MTSFLALEPTPFALAAARPVARPGMIWVITAPSLHRLSTQPGAEPLIAHFFGSPLYSILVSGQDGGSALPGAVRSRSFASYSAMRREMRERATPDPPRVVVLDLEAWPQTPPMERRSPARYYRLAGALARRRGLSLVATPSPNLAPKGRSPLYLRFLQSGLVGEAAKAARIIDIQAQGLERNPSLYVSFVAAAAREARTANPGVAVIAGLSTNPDGRTVSARTLYRDALFARPYVDGFWLNIPEASTGCPRCGIARPEEAIGLLRRLARHGGFLPGSAVPTSA